MFDENIDYDLTSYYFNIKRVSELIGFGNTIAMYGNVSDDVMLRTAIVSKMKDALVTYMSKNSISSIEKLSVTNSLEIGSLFTIFASFSFKGLLRHHKGHPRHRMGLPLATGSCELGEAIGNKKVNFKFSPDHLVSSTSWGELSGRGRKLFLFGVVKEIKCDSITVIPYVIASPLMAFSGNIKSQYWLREMQVRVSDIDNFNKVAEFPKKFKLEEKHLDVLKNIPEKDVKTAFREILDESYNQKDWGGERSDLFSTQVSIRGRSIDTSFAFKGPSKFRPMTMADLGKNGDQIPRLVSECSDLMVVQHCHFIVPFVRSTLRAFSMSFSSPRLFMLIDGIDTIKLFYMYDKLKVREKLEHLFKS